MGEICPRVAVQEGSEKAKANKEEKGRVRVRMRDGVVLENHFANRF
jgi:hypothetical protein